MLVALIAVGCASSGSLKLPDQDSRPEWVEELSPDGQSPAVLSGEVWCSAGSSSSGDLFFVEVIAYDPQGTDDLAPWGLVAGLDARDGTQVFEDAILVCGDDLCQASWRDGIYEPVTCLGHEGWRFTATLVDRSGNRSEPYPLTWRD